MKTADGRTFEDFYRREFALVFRAVYLSTGDRDDAFDATQEAFKRAFVRWSRLAHREWAGGWVMTTALNVSRRRRPHRAWSEGTPVAEPRPERVDVAEALRRLPPRQRTATVLYYVGDHALPVVAELMGITEGAVKAHLAQARAALRGLLEVSDA